jgi:hypothetical protein
VIKTIRVTIVEEEEVPGKVTKESTEEKSSNVIMIVVPAIVVGLLVAVAVTIGVRIYNKKRQRSAIVIKKHVE